MDGARAYCIEGMEIFKQKLLQTGEFPSIFMTAKPDQIIPLFMLPKQLWPNIARVAARGSEWAFHVAEAWKAKVSEEEWQKDKRPAGERDNRTETLIMECRHKDGFRMVLNQDFEHDWDGKIKWVGEVYEIKSEHGPIFSRVMDGVYEA